MDLASITIFLAMYYLRPQEWFPSLSNLHPVQLTMFMGVSSLLSREKAVRPKDLFRTPHDFAMVLFFAWLCLTSSAPYDNFKLIMPLMVFYWVIVQTLNSVRRMQIFLAWWCLFILVIAALALDGEYGHDLLDSYRITHGWMKGRLSLNLSIFNNPNALAHSVVPVIPMLYFLMLWKRPVLVKNLTLGLMGLPLYCVYLTISKGSYISGFGTMVVTLTFGRPKYVQVLILLLAAVLGTGALYALPRMTELSKTKSDEAIQGRVAAYTYGYRCVTTMWTGVGYLNWMTSFYTNNTRVVIIRVPLRISKTQTVLARRRVSEHYWKAAHGSFNQMGAELGFPGLVLFLLMVWCSVRTLITCKVVDVEEERVRRILFVLMVTYLISSWMVDFGYRPTFFMFTAATAAFHRHLRGIHRQQDEEIAAEKAGSDQPWWVKARSPEMAAAGAAEGTSGPAPAWRARQLQPSAAKPLPERPEPAWMKNAADAKSQDQTKSGAFWQKRGSAVEEMTTDGSIEWNQLGIVDFIGAFGLGMIVLRIWNHVIHSM